MRFITAALSIVLASQFSQAMAQDSLSVGYFSEWPLPAHYGQSTGAYDDALGAPLEWHKFDSSPDLYAALSIGEIQVALSEGVAPFLLLASTGQDFRIVDVAVSYPKMENCVVNPAVGYSPQSPNTLKNTRIAVPMGTTVHFGLLKQLRYLGVNPATVKFNDMTPARAAAALTQGETDIACGWGPALDRMHALGQPLLRPEDKQSAGAYTFDSTIIRASFGADNPEVVARFLKVTNDLNASFNASPKAMIPRIAESTEMTVSTVTDTMNGFDFPNIETKLDAAWLGGGTQIYLKELADFFVNQGTLDAALDDYAGFIDPSYLQIAADLPLIDSE